MKGTTVNRVVITGGAGFIGSHVAARFAAEAVEVHVVDSLVDGSAANVPASSALHVCDAAGDDARPLFRTLRPDVVLHFAADATAVRDARDTGRRDDVLTSRKVFAHAAEGRRDVRFLFASTVGILASDDHGGLSAYAAGKLAVERTLAELASQSRVPHVSLRFANVYGPRQDGSSALAAVPAFCRAIARGQPPRIYGDGGQTRDFIHVTDVAEAVWRATMQPQAHGPLTVATGRSSTVLEVARLVCDAAGAAPHIEFAPAPPGEPRHSSPDPASTCRALGWKASIELESGIEETVHWYRHVGGVDVEARRLFPTPGCSDGPTPALGAGHVDLMAADDPRAVHQRQALAHVPGV